jgi:transposase InsO family protein
MKQPTYISRKELAMIISEHRGGDSISVDQVRRNERLWGLGPARGKDVNKRVVRYHTTTALSALRAYGLIPATANPEPGKA